ncbi:hypothetical protein TWF730_009766 [Orbilia blumenaviensis]|uniref:Uncharacterized protein n=1 Tax=Orbilia blumenaviensis TaxID=1796055 RepID=A0AAV9USP3_9PEZI
MLTRSAYRGGRRFTPNTVAYARTAWSSGFAQVQPISILSSGNAVVSALSRNILSHGTGLRRTGAVPVFSQLLGSKCHFSTSLIRPKRDPFNDEEDDEGLPFLDKDGDRQMAELLGRMGGNSRHMRKIINEVEQELEKKQDEDTIGPYDDFDEDIDPFEQDPDEEPAYKTVYLPNEKLDEMFRTGFLKPLHEIDPLEHHELEPEVEALPHNEKGLLKKFFMRLQMAKAHPCAFTYKQCWRLFRILYSKTHLAKLFNEDAWARLWALEKDPIPSPKKIWLGDLMCYVGAELTEEQWIGYIEALFWHGQRDKAFQIWQLGLENKPSMIWYTIGTRLHATENQPEASKRIIDKVISRHGTAIPKLFIPTIVCYHSLAEAAGAQNLKSKEMKYNQEALKLYHQMVKYCPDIQPKEYLRVALSFLEAGYFRDAMAVYEHALTVHSNLIDDQATAMYWDYKFKTAAINAQNDPTVDEAELRYLSVSALRLMPEKEKARIIMGNWMRNLIRRNRIEPALRIARTMQTLGLRMDTTTYNLFIMLLDEHGKVGMLETLASRMIRRLLEPMYRHNATFEQVLHEPEFQPTEPEQLDLRDGVGARERQIIPQVTIRLPDGIEEMLLRFEQRPNTQLSVVNEMRPKPLTELAEAIFADLIRDYDLVPPADPATFGLLLRRCTKSNNVLKATSALDLFHKAKMTPNAALSNPLLIMISNQKAYEKLFKTQAMLADPEGFNMTPNAAQYRILWVSLYRALKSDEDVSKLPSHRKLFHDMVLLSSSVAPTRETYNYILRCFWQANDPVGAYTAMHGMALVWGLYPRKKAIEITIAGIARVSSRGQAPVARRHAYWYMKHLAASQFPQWSLSTEIRRTRSLMHKWWKRNLRKRNKMKAELTEQMMEGHDVTKKLEAYAELNKKLRMQMKQVRALEERIKKYWQQPPIGFNLPRTDEGRAAVSGAIPINLDKNTGGDEEMPEDVINQLSDYMRQRFYDGPWPQEWLDEVIWARVEMGVSDEEAIEQRKMSIFDPD